MKTRPIPFSAPMVRAILAGTKTQTRRVVKPEGADHIFQFRGTTAAAGADEPTGEWAWCGSPRVVNKHIRCPYGRPGDALWVREAHAFSVVDPEGLSWRDDPENWDVIYRADPNQPGGGWRDSEGKAIPPPWRPSIHMPRWASRITLEVTGVRVERLQDIGEADAIAEGVSRFPGCRQDDDAAAFNRIGPVDNDSFPIARYAVLWEQINGTGSWDANPWVWVVSFNRKEA